MGVRGAVGAMLKCSKRIINFVKMVLHDPV